MEANVVFEVAGAVLVVITLVAACLAGFAAVEAVMQHAPGWAIGGLVALLVGLFGLAGLEVRFTYFVSSTYGILKKLDEKKMDKPTS